jgi:hypothetical protein
MTTANISDSPASFDRLRSLSAAIANNVSHLGYDGSAFAVGRHDRSAFHDAAVLSNQSNARLALHTAATQGLLE